MSFLPAVTRAEGLPRDTLHWDCGFQWAIRKGEWKLKAIVDQRAADTTAAYEHTEAGKGIELYDLANDLEEQHDLADRHPDIVQELTEAHEGWREEIEA